MMSRKSRPTKMAHKRKYFEDRSGASSEKIRKIANEQKEPAYSNKAEMDEEEAMLEKLVFGDASHVIENLDAEDGSSPCQNMDTDYDSGVVGDSYPDSDSNSPIRQPAWHDDDDDSNICIGETSDRQAQMIKERLGPSSSNYSSYLKRQFQDVMGKPKWAELDRKRDSSDSSDSEDEILQHCGKFLSKKSSSLLPNVLKFKRVFDLNSNLRCEGWMIKSLQFHPTSTVGLVAGLNGVASLYQVDGENNSKLHSVQFERFPIRCAKFTLEGDRFIAGSGECNYFYQYDMIEGRSLRVVPQSNITITNYKKFQISPDGRYMAVAGRFGNIALLTVRSNEFVGSLKMNGEVEALAFNNDGSRLYSHGDMGEVYVWDMSSRTCVQRFIDDGCVSGLSLTFSPNGQFLATGTNHGVVNIYETNSLISSSAPQPIKRLFNLTTPITSLSFNATSEILALASDVKDSAVRLVHFPSLSVFSNFPGPSDIVKKPQIVNFSLRSGFLGIGNNAGRALLYRLTHYGNY